MFAIIRTGGKQYKVSNGDKIVVEKIASEIGEKITLDQVLMIGSEAKVVVGSPLVADAQVVATVEKQTRDPKIIVFKKKRRHNYRRKKGHKQYKTILKVIEIMHGSMKAAAPAVDAKPKAVSAPKASKAAPKKETKAKE